MASQSDESTFVTGFSHMGITVSDLARSVGFYRDVLGLELIGEWTRDEEYIRDLLGFPTVTIEAAILRVPNSPTLVELIHYADVDSKTIDATHADAGTAHLSLFVRDLDEFVIDLRAKGVQFVADPVTPTVGPNAGGRAVYILDPDTTRIELTQSTNTLA
jgi:catechol 2,3-dioxygenase-like lactoylglutathione lyase family enzyme